MCQGYLVREERWHLSDAVLVSVMICCVADGAVAQVVVPFGLAKAGLLSGSPAVRVLVLGVQAASKIITVPHNLYAS